MKMPLFLIILFFALKAHADVFILTETARGEFENGVYSKGHPEFGYRLEITATGKATLSEIVRLSNNEVISINAPFVATVSNSLPVLASPVRAKEPISIFVGKTGDATTEIFMLGSTYFEYVKASQGRIQVASGRLKKSVSGTEDTIKQLTK